MPVFKLFHRLLFKLLELLTLVGLLLYALDMLFLLPFLDEAIAFDCEVLPDAVLLLFFFFDLNLSVLSSTKPSCMTSTMLLKSGMKSSEGTSRENMRTWFRISCSAIYCFFFSYFS